MLNRADYIQILGLGESFTKAELKSKYNKLSLEWHPDKNSNANAVEKFGKITEAYKFLTMSLQSPVENKSEPNQLLLEQKRLIETLEDYKQGIEKHHQNLEEFPKKRDELQHKIEQLEDSYDDVNRKLNVTSSQLNTHHQTLLDSIKVADEKAQAAILVLEKEITETIQRIQVARFSHIYEELYKKENSFTRSFRGNFMANKRNASPSELIREIYAQMEKHPKSRTKIAWDKAEMAWKTPEGTEVKAILEIRASISKIKTNCAQKKLNYRNAYQEIEAKLNKEIEELNVKKTALASEISQEKSKLDDYSTQAVLQKIDVLTDSIKKIEEDLKKLNLQLEEKNIDSKKDKVQDEFALDSLAQAFRKIYKALYDGQSSFFKSNANWDKKTHLKSSDFINEVKQYANTHKESRTAKAWELAQQHCQANAVYPGNVDLFREVYKWSFQKSGPFKKSNILRRPFYSSVSLNSQVPQLTVEDIHAAKNNESSRTAKIYRALE